jgi:hypothetical protein
VILDHYSYKDFKTDFYSKIKDVSIFEAGDFNFIKVITECLVVRYAIKGKIRQYVFYTFPGLFLSLKRISQSRNKQAVADFKKFEDKYEGKTYDVLLIDNGRTLLDKNGKKISFYFHNVRSYFFSKNISFLQYYERHDFDLYPDDFFDSGIKNHIKFSPLTVFDKELLGHLKSLFTNIKKENFFTPAETENIKSGLTVFYESAKLWNFYLTKFKPKTVFLLGHYHREGLIYACKKNKVEVRELQHGLIAEEDIFYVLPDLYKPIKDKSLFADKILTYGTYWNNLLKKGNEYAPEQIKTLGYYLYEDTSGSESEEKLLREFCKDHKVVLVTTQAALHNDFCSYVRGWMDTLKPESKIRFILKLHPADKDEWYKEFLNNNSVLISRTRLEVVFKYATIHVTSYSTTIFDAFRYNVKNYSVNFPSSADYVKTIVDDGFSELLGVNEYPDLNNISAQANRITSTDFFETPKLERLLE